MCDVAESLCQTAELDALPGQVQRRSSSAASSHLASSSSFAADSRVAPPSLASCSFSSLLDVLPERPGLRGETSTSETLRPNKGLTSFETFLSLPLSASLASRAVNAKVAAGHRNQGESGRGRRPTSMSVPRVQTRISLRERPKGEIDASLGGQGTFKLEKDAPVRSPARGEVLVRVECVRNQPRSVQRSRADLVHAALD